MMEINIKQIDAWMGRLLEAEKMMRQGKLDAASIEVCLIYESLNAHVKRYIMKGLNETHR